jgi:hypothetical protein
MPHLSPDSRSLPSRVRGFFDADAARRELEYRRAFASVDDAAAGGFRKAVDSAPLRESQHPIRMLHFGLLFAEGSSPGGDLVFA